MDVEIDVAQNWAAGRVPEGDALVADVAAQATSGNGVRRIGHIRLGVQQLAVAAEASDALGVDFQTGIDFLDGPQTWDDVLSGSSTASSSVLSWRAASVTL